MGVSFEFIGCGSGVNTVRMVLVLAGCRGLEPFYAALVMA